MSGPLRPAVAILTLLLAIAFAASPYFVDSFNGFDPNQFPVPQDNPPVQPAGYAFAIWGAIYLWLILGAAWGLFKARQDGQWHDMRLPLCLSLAVGSTWLWVATQSPVWAAVLIWVMLLSALGALFVAPVRDRAWAAYPVGLYAGWLSAASCVSLGLLAAGYGYLDENIAGLIFVALAALIGAAVQAALGRTPTYGIAVIWALIAVIVANWTDARDVAYVALAGAVIVALATLRTLRTG
ncbi:tryptophan-rich sensory protein [Sulfitobacter aestuariivivens]|uniref:Tryptophan-rich sensory protein n=1 Tax=Sulfitobacter aestuariivivens TaxID=2766981 RepID=A0A927CZV1_9RHOB|nr:tryptophan-rich sensory protein [Sulfitobacter aestuariivivens]MBD3662460.1 tryptophan-rich sensory protein [Sulfitobacter aestuariivivens]